MPAVEPRVELLAHTPEPLSLIYAAFRQCYHAGFVADMWPRLLDGEISRERQAEFVASVLASGHASPAEHVSFTFALSGVSRALTHSWCVTVSRRTLSRASVMWMRPPWITSCLRP